MQKQRWLIFLAPPLVMYVTQNQRCSTKNLEHLLRFLKMCTLSTESVECGRDCVSCNQEGDAKKKNMCRKSNVLYNWECNGPQCDAGYDGQSSKNNFTRSGQHKSLYESWKRREDGSINPKTGRVYAKPQSHSFLYDHQVEDHSGAPPDFTLHSKRYYGRDRLACQVAEGVSLKLRT